MKNLSFFFLFLLGACVSVKAQVMAANPQWATIKSANLRCWECKERLDRYLVKENNTNMDNGMLKWTYNLLNGEIKVQFLPDRVSLDDIRTALNNAGFDADNTKADSLSYKKLPPACKLPADGGGPQNGKPCHLPPEY